VLEIIKEDILEKATVEKAVKNIDTVVHLAAFTEVVKSLIKPQLAFDLNIQGTINLLETSKKAGIKNFVFASSNAAVGEAPVPINENAVPQPISPYGATKLCGEALCSGYANAFNMKITALRFANAYGLYSNHKTSVIAKMLKEIINNKPLTIYGTGKQTRDFINARDIAQAIWLSLIRKGNNFEVFQVASGKEVNILQLIKLLKNTTGKKPFINFEPARAGEIQRNYSDIRKLIKVLNFKEKTILKNGIIELYKDLF
jgi:UDP-glucose 4-epimerase